MCSRCWRRWPCAALGLLVVWLTAAPVQAQFRSLHPPERLEAGQATNLFATWEGLEACDGLMVDFPAAWRLLRVHVLQYGYKAMPVQARQVDGGTNRYVLAVDEPLKGPIDIVLHVRTGDVPGPVTWSITPFVESGDGIYRYRDLQDALRMEQQTRLEDAAVERDNRVLHLRENEPVPLLRPEALPNLGARAAHTIEFWMRTTGLGEAVLSAWDGDERQAYPLEFMVEANGRLFYYRGRPGEHQSMTTPEPVADGRWHHVALTHDPAGGWSRLYLDGRAVDSLSTPAPLPVDLDMPVALGGRLPGSDGALAAPHHAYSGLLDEVRFWDQVRTAQELRGTMRQPLGRIEAQADRSLLVLDFEEPLADDLLEQRTTGAERITSDLVLSQPMRDLRAQLEPDEVILSWQSADPKTTAFVIERSSDGRFFEPIHRIDLHGRAGADGWEPRTFSYHDVGVTGQVLFYRIRQQFDDETERTSAVLKVGLDREEATGVQIQGAYPNPFNPVTTIEYEVLEAQHITITVSNLAGQQVRQLVDAHHEPGAYQVTFQAGELPSGPYFVIARTGQGSTTWKVTLAK